MFFVCFRSQMVLSCKGKLTGQLVSDETKKDLARAFCDFEPGIEIPTEYVDVDESHQAIVCRVEGGAQKPYAYDGRPYRRVQSTTVKMPQEQYATLINRRGGFQSKWELQHEEDVSLDDVDLNEVTRTAKIAVAEGRLSADVDVNDPKDLLRRFGLLKGDQPLNGAMALFGKGLMYYPQCIHPKAGLVQGQGQDDLPRQPHGRGQHHSAAVRGNGVLLQAPQSLRRGARALP